MKNSHSPAHSPSFLSDSYPSPKSPETLNALSSRLPSSQSHMGEDQVKRVQDLFDGFFNYVSCTNDDIIEVANQIERNCSTTELLVETLKSQKDLIDKSKNNDSPKLPIQETSPLGKRPNPYLNELDKEALLQASNEIENPEPELILEEEFEDIMSLNYDSEEEGDSIETEAYDADFSTSTDEVPISYQDKQTQTSPVIPIQNNFSGPPHYFLVFSLPANTIKADDSELEPQQKRDICPSTGQEEGQSHGPLILVQPVYLVQPQQILNSLPPMASSSTNEQRSEMEQ